MALVFELTHAGYSASLPWSVRLKIAVGAAKGLEFLHEAEKPVIYRDFKASNILLDSVSYFSSAPCTIEWFNSEAFEHGIIQCNSSHVGRKLIPCFNPWNSVAPQLVALLAFF